MSTDLATLEAAVTVAWRRWRDLKARRKAAGGAKGFAPWKRSGMVEEEVAAGTSLVLAVDEWQSAKAAGLDGKVTP